MPMGYRSEGASKEKVLAAGTTMLISLAGAGVGAAAGVGIGFLVGGPPGIVVGAVIGAVVGAVAAPLLVMSYEAYRERIQELEQREAAACEVEARHRQEADKIDQEKVAIKEALERAQEEILSEKGRRMINNINDAIRMAKRMAQRQGVRFDEELAKQSIKEDYGVDVHFLEELQDPQVSEQLKGVQEALNLASIPQHLVSKKRLPDDKEVVTGSISVEQITVRSQADANKKVTFLKAPAGDEPAKFFVFSKDSPVLAASINAPNNEAKRSSDNVTVLVLPRAFQV